MGIFFDDSTHTSRGKVVAAIIITLLSYPIFGEASAELKIQDKCSALFTGLLSDELTRQLNDIGNEKTTPINILSEPSDLDHSKLGPEAEEVLKNLNQLMIGHDEVKLVLARAVQRGVSGTKKPNKPVSTILLLGITGVGKTLTAEALTEAINGDPNKLVIINGGEMQEDHEIAKITGSPAGYIGHSKTPPLVTQELLNQNTSKRFKVNVVLVDELEKGSASLQRLLLGVMDKGRMTTGTNEVVDFSNTILIITSNLGQTEMNKIINEDGATIGFTAFKEKATQVDSTQRKRRIEKAALDASKKTLSPEFRNRIDHTFVFDELSTEESIKVLNNNLAAVQRKSFFSNPETSIVFNVNPEARDFILAKGYAPEFGGRSILRIIELTVVEPLTNLIGSNQIKSGDLVDVALSRDGDDLVFRKVAQSLSVEQQRLIYSKIYGEEVPTVDLKNTLMFNAEQYRSKDFLEFIVRLEAIADPWAKLDRIESFLLNSPDFGDAEFLDLYSRLPTRMDWGRKESTFTTEAMRKAGFGNWISMSFEPLRLRFIWEGMQRIKTLSASNRKQMNALIGEIEKNIDAWLNDQEVRVEFKNDLKRFLIDVHDKVMNLPAPN